MTGHEKFRVFRLDEDGTPTHVGTFDAPSPKEAIKKGIYADRRGGRAVYEAHVLRNASVFDGKSRIEQFIDSVTQLNTAQYFTDNPPN